MTSIHPAAAASTTRRRPVLPCIRTSVNGIEDQTVVGGYRRVVTPNTNAVDGDAASAARTTRRVEHRIVDGPRKAAIALATISAVHALSTDSASRGFAARQGGAGRR